MRKIVIITLIPFYLLGQEIEIEQLPGNINTNGTEINFLQINDSTAFFTAINNVNEFTESAIYACKLVEDEWKNKRYAKYNFDTFNTANINFSKNGKMVFSVCNKEMQECKIGLLEAKHLQGYKKIPLLYQKETHNTQGHITKHNFQEVLYFVSNRSGGFGGLDIWLSMIDRDGNFGVPINAGSKINSSADEITPFFNTNDGSIYFSSNRKEGLGGFDVYKTEGKFNLWNRPENVKELNTPQDEMYLTFYDENTGYLSSNRNGAKSENPENCCNDIFSFKFYLPKEGTMNTISEINNYLPLALYFHNADPDASMINSKTQKTYKDSYILYFKMKDEYQRQNTNLNNFFEKELQANFNNLNIIFDRLLLDLVTGNKIKIKIKGYASPLHNPEYNQALSKRRITSLVNYLKQYNNAVFDKYIQSQDLIISELPFGESASSEKVSDNPNDKKNSIYSIEAMHERKIEIVEVTLEK